MGSQTDKLSMFFLPFVTAGHLIPMVDEARVFAMHGVDVIIILTQANAALFQKNIDRDFVAGHNIRIHTLRFPSAEVGLPDGIESLNTITSMEMVAALFQGLQVLQKPIEQLLYDQLPDCIVADMFFPWTLDVANQLGIPRLAFRGTSYFSLCAEYCVRVHEPHKSADSGVVSLTGFPHKIEMLISQLPDWSRTTTQFTAMMDIMRETEEKSYGVLMNSFQELEKDYKEYFKTTMGLKTWSIGPVSLWVNRNVSDKVGRFNIEGMDGHEVIDWLNSKEHNSVLLWFSD
ncbi:soyasapogenol B glucuronide galactosyltransferase, partial [Ziziphus jujuba]|uniref:Soyasapogenol B glucuronide galactosyltransferase n=1 Tax=Ziziphus jujuba TaxID=326968 RepID=A0ABM4ADN9_ZIZJJ